MRLKSLQLQGFKSFPDKIELTFDDGLTAVVGPNGSGKSNIGDAVRWVLGEQSSKNLRGNRMEDVIFAGTKSRNASGFASVTLTIDNTDRDLEVDSDTVSVNRKLFRSGDSEYSINGKSVRLKDISELFMDTGLGRDGYSIIGQGKISEIVSAKSSERREIFEEASGISKFKYKKTEAQRKLDLAEENIVRLNDIVSELESRLEPLKVQSEKAKQYLILAERRKSIEVSVWLFKINDLRYALEGLKERINIANSQYTTLEAKVEDGELEIQSKYSKMQESSAKVDDLQTEILRSQQKASNSQSEVAVYKNDIQHAEQKLEELKRSIKDSDTVKYSLSKKIESINGDIVTLSDDLKVLSKDILQKDDTISTLKTSIDALELKNSNVSNSIEEVNGSIHQNRLIVTSCETTIQEATLQLNTLDDHAKELEAVCNGYLSDAEDVRLKIAECSNLDTELNNRLSGFERLLSNKSEKLKELNSNYQTNSLNVKYSQHRVKILTDLENSMEGFSKSVKLIFKAVERGQLNGVFGTVAKLFTTKNEYTTAIETALGGTMQNIVVQNEDVAKRCIRYLHDINGGRATFLPTTSISAKDFNIPNLSNEFGYVDMANHLVSCDSAFDSIKSSLLGRIVVMESIDCATVTAKKFGYRFKIVTLDGQVVNAGGSFTGGSAVHSGGIFSRKVEIDTINSKLTELLSTQEALVSERNSLQSEVDSIDTNIVSLRQKVFDNRTNKVQLEAEYKRLLDTAKQLKDTINSNDSQNGVLTEKISTSTEKLQVANDALKTLSNRLDSLKLELQETLSNKETLNTQHSNLVQQVYSLRVLEAKRSKDLLNFKATLNSTIEELSNVDNDLERVSKDIAVQKDTIEDRRQSIRDSEALEKALSEKIVSLKEEVSKWQAVHRQHEQEVTTIRVALKSVNEDKEKLSRELIRLEERKNTTQRDYDDLIAQLFDVYEMTFSEAEEFASKVKIVDVKSAQRELVDIKSSIKSLGHVNVSAIDEYKEVSERYSFMNEQLNDTKKSKLELEKIIANLTNSMKSTFTENFYKINEHFKQIFVELFGGGSAELVLTNVDDVLNCGIEIVVAPPGKVIKNLISLSGGEQAFVAIAIYFAILKVKPSPFCILDEIDAPLDEVNVRKYAVYLHRYLEHTQFIVVTHRRGTMESANVLYGVTMQKDGVSKLLKMEQKDVPTQNF